jgi:LPS sulfotransferase NodH
MPDEWTLPTAAAHAANIFAMSAEFEDPGYFDEIIARTRTPNGVFGIKMMWSEMQKLRQGSRWIVRRDCHTNWRLDVLPNLHYIRVSRRDRIRQAISLYLAVRTERWHKMRRDQHLAPAWPLEALDAELADSMTRRHIIDDIAAHLAFIREQENAWRTFFEADRITPFEVAYEDLINAPERVTREVLAFLGITADEAFEFSWTWHMQMSDERNERLLAAFNEDRARSEHGNAG